MEGLLAGKCFSVIRKVLHCVLDQLRDVVLLSHVRLLPTHHHGELRLHLSHADHLLSEVVLVLADRAVPSADCLVFTDHDVFGDFVEKSI